MLPYQLLQGDCLELMATIPSGSVDMVMCDLPYGTTACKWDSVIPFEPLWAAYKRVCKPNAAIVLTASQPFTSLLVASNVGAFRHAWVWEKEQGVNFQLAKVQPLKVHEDVTVFGFSSPNYYPQGLQPCNIRKSNRGKGGKLGHVCSEAHRESYEQTAKGYPRSVVEFGRERGLHPTQKARRAHGVSNQDLHKRRRDRPRQHDGQRHDWRGLWQHQPALHRH